MMVPSLVSCQLFCLLMVALPCADAFTSPYTTATARRSAAKAALDQNDDEAAAANQLTWILEKNCHYDDEKLPNPLEPAALEAGHEVARWKEQDWEWEPSRRPKIANGAIFHGTLGVADALANGEKKDWFPSLVSFCNTEAFICSNYYPMVKNWLIHQKWHATTVAKFVENPEEAFNELGSSDAVFVRPDSPLKAFSGRVLQRDEANLRKLDHGFYYDDENLPIIVAPICDIAKEEWRFVIVDGKVVAGSAYQADGRQGYADASDNMKKAWDLAEVIASEIQAPEDVYVIDIGECKEGDKLHLLELGPFSGCDLYECDRAKIVEAVEELLEA
ncbi:MAG: hypothetical protein SGILL_006352 [Bacillariaceae sp.]